MEKNNGAQRWGSQGYEGQAEKCTSPILDSEHHPSKGSSEASSLSQSSRPQYTKAQTAQMQSCAPHKVHTVFRPTQRSCPYGTAQTRPHKIGRPPACLAQA